MSLYGEIYRTGVNYKPNLRFGSDDYVEQFNNTFGSSTNPEFESVFNNYHELDDRVRELCGGEDDDFEFEITSQINDELMAFAIKSDNPQAHALILTCKEVFKAIREGYRVFYLSEK